MLCYHCCSCCYCCNCNCFIIIHILLPIHHFICVPHNNTHTAHTCVQCEHVNAQHNKFLYLLLHINFQVAETKNVTKSGMTKGMKKVKAKKTKMVKTRMRMRTRTRTRTTWTCERRSLLSAS